MNNITVQKEKHTTIILINRPEVKNAVDGQTAQALADAFRAFEKDEDSYVAILGGLGGTFCAGADLKALATDNGTKWGHQECFYLNPSLRLFLDMR